MSAAVVTMPPWTRGGVEWQNIGPISKPGLAALSKSAELFVAGLARV